MTTTAIRSLGDAPEPADGQLSNQSAEQAPNLTTLRAIPAGPVSSVETDAEWTRDRVVGRLLAHGLIPLDRVAELHTTWAQARQDGSREPFWRFLARQDGMDRGRILRMAAAAYGFSPVRVSLVGTLGLVDFLRTVWPPDAFSRLAGMSAVPVAAEEGSPSARLIVASDDPCQPELGRYMDSLVSGPYELRFASSSDLAECYDAVRQHLPDLIPEGLVRLGKVTSASVSLRRAA